MRMIAGDGRAKVLWGSCVCVWAVASLLGCGRGDPAAGDYSRARPARGDIVGTWAVDLSMTTDKGLSAAEAGGFSIALNEDGTCRVVGMPARMWGEGSRASGAALSAAGTWELEKLQEWWNVRLALYETGATNPTRDGPLLHIRRQSAPHLLHWVVGDPDEGIALVFRRGSTATSRPVDASDNR